VKAKLVFMKFYWLALYISHFSSSTSDRSTLIAKKNAKAAMPKHLLIASV